MWHSMKKWMENRKTKGQGSFFQIDAFLYASKAKCTVDLNDLWGLKASLPYSVQVSLPRLRALPQDGGT